MIFICSLIFLFLIKIRFPKGVSISEILTKRYGQQGLSVLYLVRRHLHAPLLYGHGGHEQQQQVLVRLQFVLQAPLDGRRGDQRQQGEEDEPPREGGNGRAEHGWGCECWGGICLKQNKII